MTQNTDLTYEAEPPHTVIVMVYIMTAIMWGILGYQLTGDIATSVATVGTVFTTLMSATWVMA